MDQYHRTDEGSSNELLSAIVAWAIQDPDVRGLILTGSRARGESDDLSDFDIEMFVQNPDRYVQSDAWMAEIRSIWVYLPLEDGAGNPTRLVIFEGGAKVDFSIYPVGVLKERVVGGESSPLYDRGFKVLVDKDDLAAKLPTSPRRASRTKKPSEQEFIALVQEFWFEAYHVAKYLKRQDLWAAKSRDWGLKELFLQMVEWREKAIHGWSYDTRYRGVRMEDWVDPSIWQKISGSFAHFDAQESWRALRETMDLFRSVASEVAQQLRYRYPDDVEENLSGYIDSLQQR